MNTTMHPCFLIYTCTCRWVEGEWDGDEDCGLRRRLDAAMRLIYQGMEIGADSMRIEMELGMGWR